MAELVQLGRLWNFINWTTLKYLEIVHPRMPQEERYRRFMNVRAFFNPELAVGQHEHSAPIRVGQSQFEYLKSHGLEPQNSLLDYGCGALRLGRHAIPYLEPGRYFGLDISESMIGYARKLVKESGWEEQSPTLCLIEKSGVPFDTRFDYAIAQSVFTHTDSDTTLAIMKAVAEHMHESSRFLATFWIRDEYREVSGVDYFYPAEMIRKMAAEAGLHPEFKKDYVHPSQDMVVLRPAAGS